MRMMDLCGNASMPVPLSPSQSMALLRKKKKNDNNSSSNAQRSVGNSFVEFEESEEERKVETRVDGGGLVRGSESSSDSVLSGDGAADVKRMESAPVMLHASEKMSAQSEESEESADESELDGLIPLDICPFFIFHGDGDQSVPVYGMTGFAKYLEKLQTEVYVKIYEDKTHTAPIIEDPIQGRDPLMCDLLRVIYPNENMKDIVKELEDTMRGGLRMPQFVISLARLVCPF